jgi:hypothetical protein
MARRNGLESTFRWKNAASPGNLEVGGFASQVCPSGGSGGLRYRLAAGTSGTCLAAPESALPLFTAYGRSFLGHFSAEDFGTLWRETITSLPRKAGHASAAASGRGLSSDPCNSFAFPGKERKHSRRRETPWRQRRDLPLTLLPWRGGDSPHEPYPQGMPQRRRIAGGSHDPESRRRSGATYAIGYRPLWPLGAAAFRSRL